MFIVNVKRRFYYILLKKILFCECQTTILSYSLEKNSKYNVFYSKRTEVANAFQAEKREGSFFDYYW